MIPERAFFERVPMTRVAIIGGCRTPFVKAAGVFKDQSFLDLGIHVTKSLVSKLDIKPASIGELIFGTVLLDPRLPNYAREVILRSGLPPSIPAHAISNNCISGLVAVTMLSEAIRSGRVSSGLAGGSESMSRPTLTLSSKGENFFLSLARARSLGERLSIISSFRPKFVVPQPPSPKEPSTGLTMGEHCEITAKEFQVSRPIQDQIALRSHQNGFRAQQNGILTQEIVPLNGVDKDNLIRGDTTAEKLASLKPVFDRSGRGTLTAGNSSALTDGASMVYLMAEESARAEGREILAFVEGVEYAAINPADGLLMAPAIALPRLLKRHNLTLKDIDIFEVHEAFGAQVEANLLAWERGWNKFPEIAPFGRIPVDRMNVNGGSIALGHPFAATGGRILLATANELKRRGGKWGVISICAAGAMACAMLVRRGE